MHEKTEECLKPGKAIEEKLCALCMHVCMYVSIDVCCVELAIETVHEKNNVCRREDVCMHVFEYACRDCS